MANAKQKCSKKKGPAESVTLRCDWADCGLTSTDTQDFVSHVEVHAAEDHTEVENSGGGRSYKCMWQMCGFTTMYDRTIKFHVNYHGYHTKLKAIGAAVLAQNTHLQCHHDTGHRNMVGMVAEGGVCEWERCEFSTDNYNTLLHHTNTHVTGQPRRANHQIVYCLWQGCGRSQKDMTKLKSHLRSHTQEKAAACPMCGTQFASKTKFIDHCERQTTDPTTMSTCSHCKKSFPSERILQDHFRVHVHMYKCPMCDMTCPYKHALALHMRYRHLKDRPFVCSFCQHKFTTEGDLKTHYQSHSDENYWVCEEPECDFRARSNNGLLAHIRKVHGNQIAEYGCHICDATYNRGAALTLHLKRQHAYRWASGTSRFRYIKDESGVHRLQSVRHESLEVVEQIVANATIRRPRQRKRFTITATSATSIVIGELHHRDDEDESDADDPDEEDELEMECGDKEQDVSHLITYTGQQEQDDQSFGERLKQHLGLVEGFIKVVKPD